MNLYKLNIPISNHILIDNNFIDNFLPKAQGEYVKIYILILRYAYSGETGFNSSFIAKKLNLLESDIKNALNYWNDVGLIKLTNVDDKILNIDFLNISESNSQTSSLNLISEINNNDLIDFFKEIEIIIGRPLSQKEMESYIDWTKNLNFSYELILYLVSYCVSKNKKDFRYIEKVAIAWSDSNIKTLDEATSYTEKYEKQFVNYRKILTYLGMSDTDISKPIEDLFSKWLITYNMPLELIYKACDICFSKLSKNDFNYIDGILCNFKNSNIYTVENLEKHEIKKNTFIKDFSKDKIKNTSSNFTQRTYDYDKLEKILIQNNIGEINSDD